MLKLTRPFIAIVLMLSMGIAHTSLLHGQPIQSAGTFEQASMKFDGTTLAVTTGVVTREWQLTSRGLATTSVRHEETEYCGNNEPGERDCDWDLGDLGVANLTSLTACKDDDEHFTSNHLQVAAEFEYRESQIRVRYVVWAYPNSNGLRTQLQLQALDGFESSSRNWHPQIAEAIVAKKAWHYRMAFGLMQGIKTNMNVSILKEQDVAGDRVTIDWANGVGLHFGDGGMFLVKESNKHLHQRSSADVETGDFLFEGNCAAVSGLGLYPSDVSKTAFRNCWATWLVIYQGGRHDGELALKKFDRCRFPIEPERDIYIMANTWGTEDLRPECLHAAREENVLEELESVAGLGIDVLQIDDGWQTPQWTTAVSAKKVQRGREAFDVFGDYAVYPKGWSRVRERAEQLGVKLGLWAAWTAPLDALKANYDQGDFKYFKLDFANLNTKDKYDGLNQKARDLIKYSGYTARVNWDVTEVATRMGYFSGREYGNIYLANRKPKTTRSPVLYVPYKVLRDAWHLSKYVNLNKFQITVQNVDLVLADAPTDAADHPHDYVVAIALMSSPIFFQETRHYSSEAREQVRELLAIYKKHRKKLYDGYVFPIGNEPDNLSWTGFQNHNPTTANGYLTIFRERLNLTSTSQFTLHFLQGKNLRITNLVSGETSSLTVDEEGKTQFRIPKAPGFLFLKYEVL